MTRSQAWYLGFFGALTFFWSAASFTGFDWMREFRLLRHAARAQGIVTRREPENHDTSHYEFNANGKRYIGAGPGGALGQTVTVYYLPEDPTFSTMKEPGVDLGFMILAPLALSIVAGFAARAQTGKRQTSDSRSQGHRL